MVLGCIPVQLAKCQPQYFSIVTLHWVQAQRQALESIATTLLASQGDTALQSLGVSAMLALVGCDTRPIGPGVYDVNSTDKDGCTVLHR